MRTFKIYSLTISLIFIIHVNQCFAQIGFQELEYSYGLAYYLFRIEQEILNKEFIVQNKIKQITVDIQINNANLQTIYKYKKNGELHKMLRPGIRRTKLSPRYRRYLVKDDSILHSRQRTIGYLNNIVKITGYPVNDVITSELIKIGTDSILVKHFYEKGMPVLTEVKPSSSEEEFFIYKKGINTLEYFYEMGFLVEIKLKESDRFRIKYTYN